jgi:CRISPR/Cas system-associated endoribonuclease Cas2
MSNSSATILKIATAFVLLSGLAGASMAAETTWEKHHPRRDQVNDRLENQNQRINQEVKQGQLTPAQAATLHKDDHAIRQEERDMAALDHGHITKADQKALDQQENSVSKLIGKPVTAKADTPWEKSHPRRDQVNDRLENQNQRIRREVKEGDLTQQQATALHKDDQKIRQEERDMAKLDNGHITKADQRALNQQETVVSNQIGH